MEPFDWHTNKELFGKKRNGGGGGGWVEIRSDSDSEGSRSLIGGTSFPLATFLWLK